VPETFADVSTGVEYGLQWRMPAQSACSFVGFSQGLSASQQYFPLTTNQHQPGLSAQKLTSEQAESRISRM